MSKKRLQIIRSKKTDRGDGEVPNRVRHRPAMAHPPVLKLFRKLQHQWDKCGAIDLGILVDEILQAGCSTRGLAEELKRTMRDPQVSDTTLRRYVQLARLPEARKDEIRKGASEKRLLAEEARKKRQEKNEREARRRARYRSERLKLERESGRPSDEFAHKICHFCIDVPPSPVPDEVNSLFAQAAAYLNGAFVESEGGTESRDLAWLELKAQKLADLIHTEPELLIRRAAVRKALKLVQAG